MNEWMTLFCMEKHLAQKLVCRFSTKKKKTRLKKKSSQVISTLSTYRTSVYVVTSVRVSFEGSPNKQLSLSILPVLKVQRDQKPFQRSQNLLMIQCRTSGPVLGHRGLRLLRDPPPHRPPPKGGPQHHHNVPILLPQPRLNLCPLLGSDQALSPSSDILVLRHQLAMAVVRAICHPPCLKYPLFSCRRKLSNWREMR